MASDAADQKQSRRRYLELLGIVLIGTLHVSIEVLSSSVDASRIYNACAAVLVIGYLAWRAAHDRSVWQQWGFRTKNFLPAVKSQLPFVLFALAVMLSWGVARGTRSVPHTFWIALVVYVLWGTAQQFALQNLLAKNLRPLIRNKYLWALAAASVFSLSHVPRFELVALALVAGFFITLAYHRHENLWASGLAHGVLGAVAFYTLLGQDPGRRIISRLAEWFGYAMTAG